MVVYHPTINYMSTKIILIKMEVNLIKKALYYFVILSSFRLNSSYNCRFWGKVKKNLTCFFSKIFFQILFDRVKYQNIALMSAVLFAGCITNILCTFVEIFVKANFYKRKAETYLYHNLYLNKKANSWFKHILLRYQLILGKLFNASTRFYFFDDQILYVYIYIKCHV